MVGVLVLHDMETTNIAVWMLHDAHLVVYVFIVFAFDMYLFNFCFSFITGEGGFRPQPPSDRWVYVLSVEKNVQHRWWRTAYFSLWTFFFLTLIFIFFWNIFRSKTSQQFISLCLSAAVEAPSKPSSQTYSRPMFFSVLLLAQSLDNRKELLDSK